MEGPPPLTAPLPSVGMLLPDTLYQYSFVIFHCNNKTFVLTAITHYPFLFKRRVGQIAWIAGERFKLEGKRKRKRKAAVRSNHQLLGQRNAEQHDTNGHLFQSTGDAHNACFWKCLCAC